MIILHLNKQLHLNITVIKFFFRLFRTSTTNCQYSQKQTMKMTPSQLLMRTSTTLTTTTTAWRMAQQKSLALRCGPPKSLKRLRTLLKNQRRDGEFFGTSPDSLSHLPHHVVVRNLSQVAKVLGTTEPLFRYALTVLGQS